MHATRHIAKRMSQRGVSRKMIELVLDYGVNEGDKVVIGRKEATQLMENFREYMRLLAKVMDKGGIVVVTEGEELITTYNCTSRHQ
jgi:hypothetical protein